MPRQISPIRCGTDYAFNGMNARANYEKRACDSREPRRFLGTAARIGYHKTVREKMEWSTDESL